LLNATVGVRRIIMRLRPDPERPLSDRATTARRRGVAVAASIHARLGGRAHGTSTASVARHPAAAHRVRGAHARLVRTMRGLGHAWRLIPIQLHGIVRGLLVRERFLGVGVATLVLVASAVSFGASASTAAGGTGATNGTSGGSGLPSRYTVAGLDYVDDGGVGGVDQSGPDIPDQPVVDPATDPQGPFLDDGTLQMPVAVDTTVADGSSLLKSYKVKSGDTLTGIAHRFGVSMMSVWWANQLTSKDELHVGQTLVIPPVSGVVVTVAPGDTLESLAKKYSATGDEILSYNGLTEATLVIGQKLIIPDGIGKAIPTPKPTKAPTVSSGGGGGGGSIHPPTGTYGGGAFAWPVPGGYISQYFHYGHPALDIAAPYGTRIIAAAAGTVIFAGWKDDMGGYQVWVSHGSGLYTAYYHMSAITVNVGQHVGRAQQIGRVGQSGYATGPHCHFEVWRGYPWQGSSYRVNPLAYL
jgi:murein DD-endopeptidase MepM/ murein hydrolase activator NlpD